MEMKWKAIVFPDVWYEGEKKTCLLCTDLGDLQQANLEFLKSTSGREIVYGDFVANGLVYSLLGYEIAGGVKIGGLRCSMKSYYRLPERLEVHYADERQPDRMINSSNLFELSGHEPELWITDPRALWMSCYALLQDPDRIKQACAVIPTRQQAEEQLRKFGLIQEKFNPDEREPASCYGALNRLRSALPDLLSELQETAEKSDPVDSDGYEIYTPEDLHYEYVTEVMVAGIFAVPNHMEILHRMAKCLPFARRRCRVYLYREPENRYDRNAIRIQDGVDWEVQKLGYVPRDVAAVLAPQMDRGETFAAWIEYVNPDAEQIAVRIYKQKQFPEVSIRSITYRHREYGQYDTVFKLSLKTRKAFYRKRIKTFCDDWQWVEIKYNRENWENFVLPTLKKCNLPAWFPVRKKIQAPQITNNYSEIEVMCGMKKLTAPLEDLYSFFYPQWLDFQYLMSPVDLLQTIRGEGRFGIKTIRGSGR